MPKNIKIRLNLGTLGHKRDIIGDIKVILLD